MSMTEQSTVIGVFRDHALVEAAIHELHHAGFRDDQIHLLEHTRGNAVGGLRSLFSSKHTTANDATDTASELANAGVAQGNLAFYQQEIESGNFVVVVQSYGQQREARDILYQHGAYDDSTDVNRMGGGGRTIPIREEQLHVNKQVVQTGEVVIHKRVITENKTFTIPVTREEVTIERLPTSGNTNIDPNTSATHDETATERRPSLNRVDSPIVEGSEMLSNGGTIRILVREEQVTFNKQPVVIEEIIVRKQQIQENRELSDTLKREEVRVEHTGNIIIHDDGTM